MREHPNVRIFISCVTKEFEGFREVLRSALKRDNVDVHVQEDFVAGGVPTLEKLNAYIESCDAVIHIAGDKTGAMAKPQSLEMIKALCPDLASRLPPLANALETGSPAFSYTQWEAYLAIYHRKRLLIAVPAAGEIGDPREGDEAQVLNQLAHRRRLESLERYPEIRFASADKLANAVLNALLAILASRTADARRNRIVLTAAIAMIAVAIGGVGWHIVQQSRHQSLLEEVLGVSTAEASDAEKQAIAGAITTAGQGAAQGDPRSRRALALLNQKKFDEAGALFRQIAEEKERAVKASSVAAAAAYRNLGAIAGLAKPKDAREAYGRAVTLDPDDREALFWHGSMQLEADNLDVAERDLERLLALARSAGDERGRYRARLRLSWLRAERGQYADARSQAEQALEIAKRNAERDASDAEWQRDLSVALNQLGDEQLEMEDTDGALASYQADFAIALRLANSAPGNARRQRDLAITYEKIGNARLERREYHEAAENYNRRMDIVARLVEPGKPGWQSELSTSYTKIGDVLFAQGKFAAALASFREGREIDIQLTKDERDNAGWQRDYAESLHKIGATLAKLNDLPEALKSFRDSIEIREQFAKANPNHAGGKIDLVDSNWKLAEYGDDSRRRWLFVVETLRKLNAEGKLRPKQARRLPEAERRLAELEKK